MAQPMQPVQPLPSMQPMQPMQTSPAIDMPSEIYQQAGMYQLGTSIAVYKPLLGNPLAIIGMMVGIIIADILLFYIILTLTNYIFYILIAGPIAAVAYGIYAFIDHNLRVYQFTNGIVRAKGQQVATIRWDQIDAIWIRLIRQRYYIGLAGVFASALASSRRTQSMTVRRVDGASFKFTNMLKGHVQLMQNIEQAVMQAHMPRAIAAYQSGQVIPFGPLTVSRQGMGNGRETIGWHEVQNVDVKRGYLQVKRTGKTFNWASVDVSKIPNLLVFMSLINGVRSGQIQ